MSRQIGISLEGDAKDGSVRFVFDVQALAAWWCALRRQAPFASSPTNRALVRQLLERKGILSRADAEAERRRKVTDAEAEGAHRQRSAHFWETIRRAAQLRQNHHKVFWRLQVSPADAVASTAR